MPAIYAHDRFGIEVAERLEENLREIEEAYPASYAIGLQGPDLFFFYRPWRHNRVNRYGTHLHEVSALPFFSHALEVVRERGRESREYAYLMGFICHFILDSECHPYVAEMVEATGVQHLEIEEEFEKLLLRMDGRDALAYQIAGLVPTDEATAAAVVPFYDGIDLAVVRQSLRDMKAVKRLFTAPGAFRQGCINTAMKATGKYDRVKGLMNQRQDNPACRESSRGLLVRFDHSIGLAAEMIGSFDESLRVGCGLNERFGRTFS